MREENWKHESKTKTDGDIQIWNVILSFYVKTVWPSKMIKSEMEKQCYQI